MGRSRAVDALRGLAVVLVLLHHTSVSPGIYDSAWFAPVREVRALGFLGVSLFLVVSGFSIHLRFARGAPFATRPFLLRRFVRLHPAYYVALAFAVASYAVMGSSAFPESTWGVVDGSMPLWVTVVVHLTLVAGTVLPTAWLSVAWTLALEEQLYLLYAAAHRWLRRHHPATWALAALAVCLAWRFGAELVLPSAPKSVSPPVAEPSWLASVAFQQAPARLFEWVLGTVVAEWYVGSLRLPRWTRHPASVVPAVAAVWAMFAHRFGAATWAGHRFLVSNVLFDPACGLAFAVVLAAALTAERASRRAWWVPGPAVWLGERSYSLYLVHLPVLVLVYNLLHGVLSGTAGRLTEAAVGWPLAVVVAAVLYRLVEAPSARWSKRIGASRPAAPVATRGASDGMLTGGRPGGRLP